MAKCDVCGSEIVLEECATCNGVKDGEGNFGINPNAKVYTTNGCMVVNNKPFVVEFPPVEFVSLKSDVAGDYISWTSAGKQNKTPISQVKGYWA